MDSSSIELVGSQISGVEQDGEVIRVLFDPALVIKTMTGSAERTKWQQKGMLIFSGAQLQQPLPQLPARCSGGDVGENIYTYRDMIPLPLASQGQAHCKIKLEGQPNGIQIQAESVRLVMEEPAKYIEHIRPE
ncbi:MAG: hypothetical protein H7842_02005 [Gammaproteobacteria bacterium SHHR-1]|uniref:hypothetical protein n=1 Tax=Magnetovirga frankeli TaxID=947516 RepID=UPI001AF827BE|nr:hypothetical protein D5125_08375 [gamma proteobacterium SS-5]